MWDELFKELEITESQCMRERGIDPVPMLFGEGDIQFAKQGAKLENIEVSEEKSVIPEGALHKNKHEDFDIDVTKKGIPVITVKDDNVETLEEIQEQKDSVVQHAEIEHNEIIFSKELTDFIEENREKWHETEDPELCLQVGMRLVKEIMENTDDNTGLIDKLNKFQEGGSVSQKDDIKVLSEPELRNAFGTNFNKSQIDNINSLYKYLKGQGLSDRNVYALMGNIMQENSQWNPTYTNPNGGAYGYYQFKDKTLENYHKWREKNGYRDGGLSQSAYMIYLAQHPEEDYRYTDYQRAVNLSNSSNKVDQRNGKDYLNKLSSTQYWYKDFTPVWNDNETSLDDITELFANTFEKAGSDLMLDNRKRYANIFSNLYSK